MKLPSLKSKHTVRQLLRFTLAVVYAVICTLIIIPQLDYQSWYPEGIRTFDLPLGIDFSRHTSSVSNLIDTDTASEDESANSDISDSHIASTLRTINSRLKAAQLSEAYLELDDAQLTIETPSGYTNQFFTLVTGKGELKFLKLNKPVEEIDLDANPFALFDETNYEETDLKQHHIRSAQFMEENEQYTYIELEINSEKVDLWNTFAIENSATSFGLSIDNIIHQAWLLPADGTQLLNPALVITEKEPVSYVILSYLQEEPFPIDSLTQTSFDVEPSYSKQQMYQLFALTIVIFIAGLIARITLLKEPVTGAIATGLIIIGAIAILKFTTLPVSILALLTLSILSLTILLTRVRAHLPLFAIMLLMTFVIQVTNAPSLASLSPIFLVFGVFGLVSTFFFKFINIYEED